MIKKSTIAIAAAAAVLVIGGGVGIATAANLASTEEPSSIETTTATPTDGAVDDVTPKPTETAGTADPTAAGEVCDPSNLNDMICLAFYPDTAVINMTSGLRAQEPLRSLPDADKIALAHKACDTFAAGGSASTVTLISTTLDADKAGALPADINNTNIFQIGALAYCNERIVEQEGTNFRWTLDAYRGMGEKAAKDSFAGGHVIQP